MSSDEFETLEPLLGWKIEYWDGCAHFTPRAMGVKTRLRLNSFSTTEDNNSQEFTIIQPGTKYIEPMLDSYIASFINSVEFCGWPANSIFREAHEDISLFFENKRGKKLSASALMIEPEEQKVIAATLITERPKLGASLELLYVRPDYQRKGIGTRMICHVVRSLKQQGYSHLTSSYHICNHQSRNFYHQLGFEDIGGDAYYLRIYIGWLRNRIWRKEKLKMLDGIEEIKQEKERLQDELYILEEKRARSIRETIEASKNLEGKELMSS